MGMKEAADRAEQSADLGVSKDRLEAISGVEGSSRDTSVFVARAAVALSHLPKETTALFTVPEARALATEVSDKYRAALAKDWRVKEVLDEVPRKRDFDNARTQGFLEVSPEAENLTEAITSFEAMLFNSPILFRVSVLAKNQPRYRSMDDVPTDEYLVVWDGVQLLVQWEQDAPFATGSGGHIVFDILAEVGDSIGYPVSVLACSPACHHKFVHGDFVTFADHHASDDFHTHGETPVGHTIHTPYAKDADDVTNIRRTFSYIAGILNTFALTQSYLDAMSYLEWRSRRDAQLLLAIAYDQASMRTPPHFIGMAKDAWNLRGSRREKRKLIGGLWLALSSLDTFRVRWRLHDSHFSELVGDPAVRNLAPLFDTGRDKIERQDLTLIRASLQEVATRMEGGRLFVATLAAAAAAFLAAFLTSVFTSD